MREVRFRFIGVLFYIIFLVSLLLTQGGVSLVRDLPTQSNLYQVIVAVVGLGALLFTSEAVGYLFNNIFLFLWNIRGGFKPTFGGYSLEWNKLSYNLKRKIIEHYENISSNSNQEQQHQRFDKRWKGYSADVFSSYFWQQSPKSLVEWVVRRHTVYFTSMSAIIGIISSLLLSGIVTWGFGLGWTVANTVFILFLAGLMIMIWFNAQCARIEGRQMIDLWLSGALNPKMQRTLKNFTRLFSQKNHNEAVKDVEKDKNT